MLLASNNYRTGGKNMDRTRRTAELTGKYVKFRDDLIKALEYGELVEMEYLAENGDDGTYNLDSPALYKHAADGKVWRKSLIKQACKEANTYCDDWNAGCFTIEPRTQAQGYARTLNARAVSEKLKEYGYNAGMYYHMD
jgi:hypothetical protein